MVGGLSTVAGSVLVGYSLLGVDMNFLIAASFMAAPGGNLMAKLMIPEMARESKEEQDFKLKSRSTLMLLKLLQLERRAECN